MQENASYKELLQEIKELQAHCAEHEKVEKELLQQKKRLESLIRYSPLAIVTLDKNHRILACNQQFEKTFQWAESELTGINLDEIIADQTNITDAKKYTEKTMKGEPVYGSGLRYRKDGTLIEVDIFGVPVIVDNEITGIYGIYRDISELKQAERALRQNEEKYRNILESMEEGYFETDLAGNFTFFNKALLKISGYSREDLLGMNNRDYVTARTAKRMYTVFSRIYKTGRPAQIMDYEIIPKDGSKRVLEVSSSLLKDAAGRSIGFRGIARDVSEQKQTARALKESEQKFKTLAEATSSAIMIYQDDTFVYTNPAAELITGYSKDELQSMKFWEFVHPAYRDTIKRRGRARQRGELPPQRYEFKIVTKTGEEKWMDFTGDLIELNNAPAGILTAFDITERKRMEEELRRLTLLDDLTGIANRRHFEEVFAMEWQRALREGNPLSLLMCDIDYFKAYNDLYGHQKGDECLQRVAAALKSISRRPGDLAARYGGEEFVILLPATNSQGAGELAERLRTGIEKLGIMNPDSPARGGLTISIGLATFIPDRLSSLEDLICDADAALYEAKRRGRNMALTIDSIKGKR